VEQRLREKARTVAPYRWDAECLTPSGDLSLPLAVRDNIGRLRYDERQVLKRLWAEWKAGSFQLEAGAAQAQAAHEQQEQSNVAAKLETVATAVNNGRFR
jgi:hypothetical protein